MMGVKVIPIDVLYQPAKFGTAFLQHPIHMRKYNKKQLLIAYFG